VSTEFRELLARKLAATGGGELPSLADVDEVIAATRAEHPGKPEVSELLDRLLDVRSALQGLE